MAGQPGVVGAPKKSLKTTLMVDFTVSLGTGTPFLDHFKTYRPVRVAMLSGESGDWAIGETVRRVCAARNVRPEDVDALWDFELPQLACPAHVDALAEGLREGGCGALVFDPLYLALLAGQKDLKASNLFDMGPLLRSISKACLAIGCTPFLVHHATKALRPGEQMELEDLAFAGIAEFARQWLLISRREPYEPGTGLHKLWLSYGGSCGQGGCASVDIDEGRLDEDLSGRTWGVKVVAGGEAVQQMKGAKETERDQKKARQAKEDESRILTALDRLDDKRKGASKEAVRLESGLGRGDRFEGAVHRLVRDGVVDRLTVKVGVGKSRKGKRDAQGLRRRPTEGGRVT
jgi:hypothetical protein